MRDKNLPNQGFDPALGSLPESPPPASPPPKTDGPGVPDRQPIPIGEAAPPIPGDLGCGLCRARPVGHFEFVEQVGAVFAVNREPVGGRLCRNCGLAVGRKAQSKTIGLGWFGLVAAFLNVASIYRNTMALRAVARLLPPAPPTELTRDPGRPTLLRVGMITPVILLGLLAAVIVDDVRNPSVAVDGITAGQCIDSPDDSFTRYTVRPCEQPHDMEIYSVIELSSGFQSDEKILEDCIADFETYVGRSIYQTSLDIMFFAPEGNVFSRGDTADCALMAYDGSPLTGSRRNGG